MDILTKVKHLAGIIPIANNESFFDMPWHDCLMPITDDYLAIEKAVFDCALAGCDTIWIVGHMNTQPLIRKRLGEMTIDPLTVYSNKELKFKRHDTDETKKEIQIYYIPIHPKDRDRRDSIAYSVLYGADIAYKTCLNISKWATPDMFFCSFPYGIVAEEDIYEMRKFSNMKRNILMVNKGKTVKDGLMLPFTFLVNDFKRCKNHLNDYAVSVWENADNQSAELPTMHYSIKDVFNSLDSSKAQLIESTFYHEITSWDKYKQFLRSQDSDTIHMRGDLRSPEKRTALNFEGKKEEEND
jgi:hypothetical protein